MLVPPAILKKVFGIEPSSVLHVGAGSFEEMEEYSIWNFKPVIWIDCNPQTTEVAKTAVSSPDIYIEACIGSENGIERNLKLAGGSSSVFVREGHDESFSKLEYSGSIKVITKRLDYLLKDIECPKFVNMDCEGSEYEAIVGLGSLIEKVEIFYLEVSKPGWGEHPNYKDLKRYLRKQGFRRICIFWYWNKGFGDAIFMRKSIKRTFRMKRDSLIFRLQHDWRRLKYQIVQLANTFI